VPESRSAGGVRVDSVVRFSLLVVALVLLLGGLVMGIVMAGALGGGDDSWEAVTTPVAFDDREVRVEIRNNQYLPRDIIVRAGATVTWDNLDGVPHTATERHEAWETGLLSKGEMGAISFPEIGAYGYFCTVHPWMRGTISVR
jgi:plastocyanin